MTYMLAMIKIDPFTSSFALDTVLLSELVLSFSHDGHQIGDSIINSFDVTCQFDLLAYMTQ